MKRFLFSHGAVSASIHKKFFGGLVLVFGLGLAPDITAQATCIWAAPTGSYEWDDYFTSSFSDGDVATIDLDDVVYITEDTQNLVDFSMVEVRGTLVFDNCASIDLDAACILVIGEDAVFRVGSSSDPYDEPGKKVNITLITAEAPPTVTDLTTNYGVSTEVAEALNDRGFVVCDGAQLYLFGENRGKSWTRLRETASKDSNELKLDASADPDWREDDEIVLASTDFDLQQTEYLRITADISNDNISVELAEGTSGQKTEFEHYGAKESYGTGGAAWEAEMFAEVGLLTRNITIQGEEAIVEKTENNTTHNYIQRGHLFFHNDNGNDDAPLIQARWVEFKNLGYQGHISRYPVHFHKLQDTPSEGDSYLKFCSVWNSVNRGIVIHETPEILLKENVVYNVFGKGVYFEGFFDHGGSKDQKCDLDKNLVMQVERDPQDLEYGGFSADKLDVSAFYIRNPRNKITGNVAAGSRQYGFYLQIPAEDTGWTWPNTNALLGKFHNNMAHSCGKQGIYQDLEVQATDQELTGCKVYKIREHGIWVRSVTKATVSGDSSGTPQFHELSWIVDCRAGFYPASSGFRDYGEGKITIKDVLFVGESDSNKGYWSGGSIYEQEAERSLPQNKLNYLSHPMPWDVLCAVENYDGYNFVEDCRFDNFEDLDLTTPSSHWRYAGLFTQVVTDREWALDPRNEVSDLTIGSNVVRNVYLRDPSLGGATPLPFDDGNNQIAHTILYDKDNSLDYGTGTNATYILPYTPFLVELDTTGLATTLKSPDGTNPEYPNGYVLADSAVDYAQLVVENHDTTNQPQQMIIKRDFSDGDWSFRDWGTYDFEANNDSEAGSDPEYAVNLSTGDTSSGSRQYYVVEWTSGLIPDDFTVKYRFSQAVGEVIYVEFPVSSTADIGTGDVLFFNPGGTVGVENLLSDLLDDTTSDTLYFYDDVNHRIVLKLVSALRDSQSLEEGTEVLIVVDAS